uniref:histidine--tRNA ligase, cytoplasmic-like n=1 Tax=Myxine glutinosa TaxID=7769 RepID=UPI00358E271C
MRTAAAVVLCSHWKCGRVLRRWRSSASCTALCVPKFLTSPARVLCLCPKDSTVSPEPSLPKILETRHKPLLKTPKGMNDVEPWNVALRQRILSTIIACFERHGGQRMDTSTLERRDVLTERYGDESKLMYHLEDQGGERLSLRYDLTVPFARYLAMYNPGRLRRYQLGAVYRREQPSASNARLRQFMQADFDIAGNFTPMGPEAECVRIMHEIFSELSLGDFVIKISDRRLLQAIVALYGQPSNTHCGVCATIDKLQKNGWPAVKEELVQRHGMPSDSADRLGEMIIQKGGEEVLQKLIVDPNLQGEKAQKSIHDLQLLFSYLRILGVSNKVKLDLSLARGVDYYTGVVFEAEISDSRDKVGSVAGGGRYDDLVAELHPKGKQYPCVGLSIGVDRLVMLAAQVEPVMLQKSITEVVVASAEKGFLEERMHLLAHLWDSGIKAEMMWDKDPSLLRQLQWCEKHGVPLVVIIGSREQATGVVGLRNIALRHQEDVPLVDIVAEVKKRLQQT